MDKVKNKLWKEMRNADELYKYASELLGRRQAPTPIMELAKKRAAAYLAEEEAVRFLSLVNEEGGHPLLDPNRRWLDSQFKSRESRIKSLEETVANLQPDKLQARIDEYKKKIADLGAPLKSGAAREEAVLKRINDAVENVPKLPNGLDGESIRQRLAADGQAIPTSTEGYRRLLENMHSEYTRAANEFDRATDPAERDRLKVQLLLKERLIYDLEKEMAFCKDRLSLRKSFDTPLREKIASYKETVSALETEVRLRSKHFDQTELFKAQAEVELLRSEKLGSSLVLHLGEGEFYKKVETQIQTIERLFFALRHPGKALGILNGSDFSDSPLKTALVFAQTAEWVFRRVKSSTTENNLPNMELVAVAVEAMNKVGIKWKGRDITVSDIAKYEKHAPDPSDPTKQIPAGYDLNRFVGRLSLSPSKKNAFNKELERAMFRYELQLHEAYLVSRTIDGYRQNMYRDFNEAYKTNRADYETLRLYAQKGVFRYGEADARKQLTDRGELADLDNVSYDPANQWYNTLMKRGFLYRDIFQSVWFGTGSDNVRPYSTYVYVDSTKSAVPAVRETGAPDAYKGALREALGIMGRLERGEYGRTGALAPLEPSLERMGRWDLERQMLLAKKALAAYGEATLVLGENRYSLSRTRDGRITVSKDMGALYSAADWCINELKQYRDPISGRWRSGNPIEDGDKRVRENYRSRLHLSENAVGPERAELMRELSRDFRLRTYESGERVGLPMPREAEHIKGFKPFKHLHAYLERVVSRGAAPTMERMNRWVSTQALARQTLWEFAKRSWMYDTDEMAVVSPEMRDLRTVRGKMKGFQEGTVNDIEDLRRKLSYRGATKADVQAQIDATNDAISRAADQDAKMRLQAHLTGLKELLAKVPTTATMHGSQADLVKAINHTADKIVELKEFQPLMPYLASQERKLDDIYRRSAAAETDRAMDKLRSMHDVFYYWNDMSSMRDYRRSHSGMVSMATAVGYQSTQLVYEPPNIPFGPRLMASDWSNVWGVKWSYHVMMPFVMHVRTALSFLAQYPVTSDADLEAGGRLARPRYFEALRSFVSPFKSADFWQRMRLPHFRIAHPVQYIRYYLHDEFGRWRFMMDPNMGGRFILPFTFLYDFESGREGGMSEIMDFEHERELLNVARRAGALRSRTFESESARPGWLGSGSWRIPRCTAPGEPASTISRTASACGRSILPFINALNVNSPG